MQQILFLFVYTFLKLILLNGLFRLNISTSQQQRCTPLDRSMWFQLHVRFKINTLNIQLNEILLEEIFLQFGPVADCTVKEYHVNMDMHTVTGYAFVYYYNVEVANQALQAINHNSGYFSDAIHFRCNFAYDVKDGDSFETSHHGHHISGGFHTAHLVHKRNIRGSTVPNALPPYPPHSDYFPERSAEFEPLGSRYGQYPEIRSRVESFPSELVGKTALYHHPLGNTGSQHHHTSSNPPSFPPHYPSVQRNYVNDYGSLPSSNMTREFDTGKILKSSLYSDNRVNVSDRRQLDRYEIEQRGFSARPGLMYNQPAVMSSAWDYSPVTTTSNSSVTVKVLTDGPSHNLTARHSMPSYFSSSSHSEQTDSQFLPALDAQFFKSDHLPASDRDFVGAPIAEHAFGVFPPSSFSN